MANLSLLRNYAQRDPDSLPNSIRFSYSDTTLTLYDAYPKSIFHFLILPRAFKSTKLAETDSLRTLLLGDKKKAKEIISTLKDEAGDLRLEIEKEMVKRYGFKWEIWAGFHAVPSMRYLHLHVVSADLCSVKLKHKKHYNSFHPKLGFFLHLEEVLAWFEAGDNYFSSKAKLEPKEFEKLLKEDLCCWRCGSEMKTMPSLKAHLQEEWECLAGKLAEDTAQQSTTT